MPKSPGFHINKVILIIIIILLIPLGLYLYSNKTSSLNTTMTPTVSWKTYVNANYKFSINYPAQWFLNEKKSSDILFINPDYQNPKSREGYLPNIEIQIDQYAVSANYQENSMIDGIKAYRASAPSGRQSAYEGLEFKRDANRYTINLLYDDGKLGNGAYDSGIYNKEAVNIFNQMISTLKFTQ